MLDTWSWQQVELHLKCVKWRINPVNKGGTGHDAKLWGMLLQPISGNCGHMRWRITYWKRLRSSVHTGHERVKMICKDGYEDSGSEVCRRDSEGVTVETTSQHKSHRRPGLPLVGMLVPLPHVVLTTRDGYNLEETIGTAIPATWLHFQWSSLVAMFMTPWYEKIFVSWSE